MGNRRFVQILPTASFGDAIGNEAIAIDHLLRENGCNTEIYAEIIDPRFQLTTIKPIPELSGLQEEDVIIYHGSTGTDLNYKLQEYPGFKIMVYHNITPPAFFKEYSPALRQLTAEGYEGIRHLNDIVDFCIADSQYNAEEIKKMGYHCPIQVCPVLIPFEDYEEQPDETIKSRYGNDETINLLFVGRIAPNKKQEDVIKAFYCYQKEYNPDSRLFLVGSFTGMDKYAARLRKYAEALEIDDKVFITGHVSFSEILAYYDLADVFVCMSEHEGFCVPVVEAMLFRTPIVAYDAGAVPETMGAGGIILHEKDPEITARAIHQIIQDKALREQLQNEQKKQLEKFRSKAVGQRFLQLLAHAGVLVEQGHEEYQNSESVIQDGGYQSI